MSDGVRVQVVGFDNDDHAAWVAMVTARYLTAPSVEDVKLLLAEMAWRLGTLTATLYERVPMEELTGIGDTVTDLGTLARMLGLDVKWGDPMVHAEIVDPQGPLSEAEAAASIAEDVILREGDSVRLTYPLEPPEDAPTIYGHRVNYPIAAEKVKHVVRLLDGHAGMSSASCSCGWHTRWSWSRRASEMHGEQHVREYGGEHAE